VEVRWYSNKVSFNTQLQLARVVGGNSYKVAEVLHPVNNVPQHSQCRHVYTGLYTHEYVHRHVTTTMLFQKFLVWENVVTNITWLKLAMMVSEAYHKELTWKSVQHSLTVISDLCHTYDHTSKKFIIRTWIAELASITANMNRKKEYKFQQSTTQINIEPTESSNMFQQLWRQQHNSVSSIFTNTVNRYHTCLLITYSLTEHEHKENIESNLSKKH